MANPKLLRGRSSEAEACYAITTVTNRRRPLLKDPALAQMVMLELERCASGKALESLAWVVMPDHVHWLFQLHAGDLGQCVRALKSRSARAINATLDSNGQVWQRGFYDHRLRDDEDLVVQARYIIANPLRRGLVERLEDYPFWWCKWVNSESEL